MYDKIEPNIPSDVTFDTIDFANVTQELVYASVGWPTQTVGGGTGDTMPETNSFMVWGSTNKPHTLGRKFLGPFIESTNTDGTWSSGLATMVIDWAAAYISSVTLLGAIIAKPVVAHYVAGLVTRVTDLLAAHFTSIVKTQRRRRRGVGA
jgi:hypothetical protein